MSVVYFVEREKDKAIKIGYSANLDTRFRSLVSEFTDVRLIGWVAGSMSDEQVYHKKFKHLRIEREWFLPDKVLMNWITKHACPIPFDEWAQSLYKHWESERDENNLRLQLKFDTLVAMDTKESIRHAPKDAVTYRNARSLEKILLRNSKSEVSRIARLSA